MDFGSITILAITVIAYLVGMIARAVPLENKWIPCICGLCGAALGIAGLYIIPDFPANNLIDAAAVGIASGLAATGADQIYRQLHPSDKGRITVYAEPRDPEEEILDDRR